MQLQDLGYQFTGKQRLGIYLTNTLDEALKKSEVLFGQFVAAEANEASAIKRDAPVMVVLGNPPYSGHSVNKSEWMAGLVRDYYYVDGLPLGERNPKWLQDDYVKFIRFGQWRISQTGFGILAFVTNHGYLDNPTFRGMRQSLMQTFTDIYVLNLHGNSKKKETCPDGAPDQNVFDIQQGVSISIFIKEPEKLTPAKVHHAELWGNRVSKYEVLNLLDIDTTEWEDIAPQSPFYLFSPQSRTSLVEYNEGWKVTDFMPVNGVGMTTARDYTVVDYEKSSILKRAQLFRDSTDSDEKVCQQLAIPMKKGWNISRARKLIQAESNLDQHIQPILYRPFDERLIFYHDSLVWRTVKQIMCHMLKGNNLAFSTTRSIDIGEWEHIFCTEKIIQHHTVSLKEVNYLFPLYLYPDTENEQGNLLSDRTPNLSSDFLSAIREKLGYIPTPEAIFYYAYAIFHSPTYRQRYAEFLKIDFPRLPLTSNNDLFQALSEKGEELAQLHLMKSKKLNKIITKYPVSGDNAVTEVTYKQTEQRVYINKQQYFEGIDTEVWAFKIGGYQVLDKWLKDRKKAQRSLSFDDILHYQKVIVALKETMQLMTEIDQTIPSFPIE